MTALITLTHRTIDHNDPDAAGFTDGYWWTVTIEYEQIESAAASREASERHARQLAASLGVADDAITVKVEDDLASRADDERRVAALVAAWRS